MLFLVILGAVNVNAQVRIGGNAAPNPAAVLDLNVDDTNTGAKGLALPRVSLTNVSTPLTGTPVVNGMMVYNTNASTTGGSGIGIYYWDGNRSKWVKIVSDSVLGSGSLISVDTANLKTGATLRFDGSRFVQDTSYWHVYTFEAKTVNTAISPVDVTLDLATYLPADWPATCARGDWPKSYVTISGLAVWSWSWNGTVLLIYKHTQQCCGYVTTYCFF